MGTLTHISPGGAGEICLLRVYTTVLMKHTAVHYIGLAIGVVLCSIAAGGLHDLCILTG
jgi:hypothetical protein